MISRVAFFHGLESLPRTEKNEMLEKEFDFVFAPPMDYYNPLIFDNVLSTLEENPVDYLIGSSMGGFFAYQLSTLLGIPTLLFNPAVHGRSINPPVKTGDLKVHHTLVLGEKDDIIDPFVTSRWFNDNKENTFINYESIGHRIPADVFNKWINNIKKIRR